MTRVLAFRRTVFKETIPNTIGKTPTAIITIMEEEELMEQTPIFTASPEKSG